MAIEEDLRLSIQEGGTQLPKSMNDVNHWERTSPHLPDLDHLPSPAVLAGEEV